MSNHVIYLKLIYTVCQLYMKNKKLKRMLFKKQQVRSIYKCMLVNFQGIQYSHKKRKNKGRGRERRENYIL